MPNTNYTVCDECGGIGEHECWCSIEPAPAPPAAEPKQTVRIVMRSTSCENGPFAPATTRETEIDLLLRAGLVVTRERVMAEICSAQIRGNLVSFEVVS